MARTALAAAPAPRPDTARAARFWDRIAPRYARRPIADMTAYETKLAMTRAHLRPEMEVLEIGCGTGGTARLHAPHVRRIRAVDVSPAMIGIARERASGIPNLSFEVAALEALAAPEGGHDMILAMSLLHLVEDRAAALARIHALLKPGGFFVSSTACLADMALWIRAILPAGRALGLFPPVAVFSAADLEAGMEAAGFAIEARWRPAPDAALLLIARRA